MAPRSRKSKTETASHAEPQMLINEAYYKIKHMIFQRKVIAGQRLIYDNLSELLKMSRTPIINALNRLEQEGFLVSQPFRGFIVKPIDVQEAWDLFGVREALEAYAVEQAIYKTKPSAMKALQEKFENHVEYEPSYYDPKKFRLDLEFHLQIAVMSQNLALQGSIRRNLEMVYCRFRLDEADSNRMAAAVQEHKKLLEKMKKEDVLESVEIIRHHVQKARDHVITCLQKSEESGALLFELI